MLINHSLGEHVFQTMRTGVSTRKSGRNNRAISECASHLIITITVSFGRARSDERAAGTGVQNYLIASSRARYLTLHVGCADD